MPRNVKFGYVVFEYSIYENHGIWSDLGPYGSIWAHIKTGQSPMAQENFWTPSDPQKGGSGDGGGRVYQSVPRPASPFIHIIYIYIYIYIDIIYFIYINVIYIIYIIYIISYIYIIYIIYDIILSYICITSRKDFLFLTFVLLFLYIYNIYKYSKRHTYIILSLSLFYKARVLFFD